MDPKRKMGHWSAQMKTTKEGSEELKGAENEKQEREMEVGEPCFKKRVLKSSPKRKVIRVESEESQDYVRETLAISHEEAEEMGFVPSALGEPRGAIHWCDNRKRSETAIRHWQIASMVAEEGGRCFCSNRLVPFCCVEQS